MLAARPHAAGHVGHRERLLAHGDDERRDETLPQGVGGGVRREARATGNGPWKSAAGSAHGRYKRSFAGESYQTRPGPEGYFGQWQNGGMVGGSGLD